MIHAYGEGNLDLRDMDSLLETMLVRKTLINEVFSIQDLNRKVDLLKALGFLVQQMENDEKKKDLYIGTSEFFTMIQDKELFEAYFSY